MTVNAISPGGITRLSGTISGAESVPEPDERPEGEFDPKDPSLRLARGGVAGQRAGRVRHRPGIPRDRGGHLADAGLDKEGHRLQRRQALGRHQARPGRWPPTSSAAGHPACAWAAEDASCESSSTETCAPGRPCASRSHRDIFRVTDDGQVEIQVAVVPDGRLERGGVGGVLLPQRALQLVP